MRTLASDILEGRDRDEVASLMGIRRATLDDKVRHGRFQAWELVMLSCICGRDAVFEGGNPHILRGGGRAGGRGVQGKERDRDHA